MIILKNISKTYNKGKENEIHALKDINLHIQQGDMVAITGPSGSGKSTLLHIIAGIDLPSTGEYLFCGKNVSNMTDKERCDIRNKKIGIIMQNFGLLGNDTVLRNVCLPEIIGGRYNKEMVYKAKEILASVGISDLAYKKTNQLSGGQKQRVAISRALAMEAEVIIADEPTGALDSENTDSFMDLLVNLNKKGITIILVSHDPRVARRCPKRYKLENGRLETDIDLSKNL